MRPTSLLLAFATLGSTIPIRSLNIRPEHIRHQIGALNPNDATPVEDQTITTLPDLKDLPERDDLSEDELDKRGHNDGHISKKVMDKIAEMYTGKKKDKRGHNDGRISKKVMDKVADILEKKDKRGHNDGRVSKKVMDKVAGMSTGKKKHKRSDEDKDRVGADNEKGKRAPKDDDNVSKKPFAQAGKLHKTGKKVTNAVARFFGASEKTKVHENQKRSGAEVVCDGVADLLGQHAEVNGTIVKVSEARENQDKGYAWDGPVYRGRKGLIPNEKYFSDDPEGV